LRKSIGWKLKKTAPPPILAAKYETTMLEPISTCTALRNFRQAFDERAPLGKHLVQTVDQWRLFFDRSARKRPGGYLVEQNIVGNERRGMISCVPIAPEHSDLAMLDLVRYINECTMRPPVRTAIADVEFKALYLFADGNDRIGRMPITLMPWKLGIRKSAELLRIRLFRGQ